MENLNKQIQELQKIIDTYGNIVFFGGAGVAPVSTCISTTAQVASTRSTSRNCFLGPDKPFVMSLPSPPSGACLQYLSQEGRILCFVPYSPVLLFPL